jgi:hypothetical protein
LAGRHVPENRGLAAFLAVSNVLLFNCCADATKAARVHDEACPLVAAARKSRGKVKVTAVEQGTIDDLNASGWPVKFCKCTKV